MLRSLSVGAKIQGIALGLIVLMIIVSIVSAVMVERVRSELELQSRAFLPLSNRIASIEATVLEGEVEAERLRVALIEGRSGVAYETVHETLRQNAEKRREQFRRARAILGELDLSALPKASAVAAARAEEALSAVESDLADYHTVLDRLLEAHVTENLSEARLLEDLLAEEEAQIFQRLERLRSEMQTHVAAAVTEIVRLDVLLDRLILALTGIAVLLGLVASYLVTRRIVRPIGDLVAGLKRVESGDLQTELRITSGDETATMARGFNEMIAGLRAKERITDTFGKYVDPRVVDALIRNPDMTKPGGDRRRMTVMFSDMTGFTGLSETLPPDSLVALLNAYFEEMASPIQEREGVIDKFIGDSIMAYWGPPFVTPERAAGDAVAAALTQLSRLPHFREKVPDVLGIPMDTRRIDLHIGIASGQTLIGTVGSARHRNYTIMGDTVNVAARLEGTCKVYGARIVVDEPTRSGTEGVLFRELDAVRVKGRSEPVRIFEPLAIGSGTAEQQGLAAAFDEGLAAYRERRFEAAQTAFERALSFAPDDRASQIFLERIQALAADPPGEDWDGIWTMDAK
jgi:adenylate cyclase